MDQHRNHDASQGSLPALLSGKTPTRGRTAAFTFLCGCLSASTNDDLDDRLVRAARSPAFRWTEFVDLATDQLAAPIVAHRFDLRGLQGFVPSVVARYFHAMLRLNRSRNAQIRAQAIEIAAALNEIDVVPLFLKGSAGLLSGLYHDPGMRIMSDIDVLVPAARGGDVMNRMVALGYVRAKSDGHPRGHGIGSLFRAGSAPVDLHRDVLAYPHEGLLPARDVFGHAVEHRHGDAAFTVPGPTHHVVLNIAHAQLNDHAYAYGHLPLRSLHDLALVLQGARDRIDWREIGERFRASKNLRALDFHCLAARELLDIETGTSSRPVPSARLLFRRARFMVGRPGLQRMNSRVVRVYLLLMRELSSPDLRARLLRNMRDPSWWRRHLTLFWKGGPH